MEELSSPENIAASHANPDFSTRVEHGVFDKADPDFLRRVAIASISIVTWLASVGFILFVPALFLFPYLFSQHVPLTDSEVVVEFAKSDPTAVFLQIIAVIPAHLLTLILAWAVITRFRKFSFTETLGWKSGGIRWWHYLIILGGFYILNGLVGHYFPEQENDLIRMLKTSRSAVYAIAFLATFTAPIVEEVIYRGILYSAFERVAGSSLSFVLVTILFALVHFPQYWPSYSTLFLLTLLSMTLTAVRVRTNNLWPCILLHTLFNGLQSILLLVGFDSATSTPTTGTEQVSSILRIFG